MKRWPLKGMFCFIIKEFDYVPECEDIDECTEAPPCDAEVGTCENTDGSFMCSCPSGYQLQSDGIDCEGNKRCEHVILFHFKLILASKVDNRTMIS